MGVLVEVKHLKKYFKTPRGMLHAVDDVSFSIERGKTLGVVGESGCGKSTLGRVVLGLLSATDGEIWFDKRNITSCKGKMRHELRRHMQIIFQDPFSSLDPRKTVRQLIAEPIKTYNRLSKKELHERVYELMEEVGLAERLVGAYPHELDGGRRQRIGVARALALNPQFIVCDEPVSALDVSIQAQILNLLKDLQDKSQLTYIFITHDLSVVKHISDEIMVMYLGCVVEHCAADDLFDHPLHPYTKGLLSAIPEPSIHKEKKKVLLTGELTSPIEPKACCRFANRCPYAEERCRQEAPPEEVLLPGHTVACFKAREINGL
ncbi:MAG: ATP-binding cassette domain-containing protein [Oscillospiraceae bacterium]|nr:ATP-binding cassette domain-containing protein [Oscillospiraceae bacterium]